MTRTPGGERVSVLFWRVLRHGLRHGLRGDGSIVLIIMIPVPDLQVRAAVSVSDDTVTFPVSLSH